VERKAEERSAEERSAKERSRRREQQARTNAMGKGGEMKDQNGLPSCVKYTSVSKYSCVCSNLSRLTE